MLLALLNRLQNKHHTLGNSVEQILYALVVLPEELLGLASGSDPANENGKEKYQKLNHQKVNQKCKRILRRKV